MTFRELVENKLPTVGQVKKVLKKVNFSFIYPEYFDIEKKNTNAGMGGYDYIQITYDKDAAKSSKRKEDVQKGIKAIQKTFNVTTNKPGLIILNKMT